MERSSWMGVRRFRWLTRRGENLSDGSVESANEFYLRDSMLVPEKKIVKDFAPGMPSYKGVLTAEQIEALILSLRSLR